MIAVALLGVLAAPSALAAGASATSEGKEGQTLTVDHATDLSATGQNVKVTGSGYPTFKGVYLAVCKVPAPGERPTPCGGGIDTSGASQTSQWVSSNAPSYAKGLTVPYGKGGTFDVTLWAAPTLPDGQDCRTVKCAVVSRTDHTRTSDRSQDVIVPITFAAAGSDDGAPVPVYVGGAVLGVVLVAALAVVGTRARRRRHADPSSSDSEPSDTDSPGATEPTP